MTVQSVPVKALRPTQIAVGLLLVKAKRKGLRDRERQPQELVDFILENPIRVVAGPADVGAEGLAIADLFGLYRLNHAKVDDLLTVFDELGPPQLRSHLDRQDRIEVVDEVPGRPRVILAETSHIVVVERVPVIHVLEDAYFTAI